METIHKDHGDLKNPYQKPPSDDAVSGAATLFVVSAVQFLTPFMLSAVGVALPSIGSEFSASAVQLGLVETVYILAFSLFLLPAGRWGIFMAGSEFLSSASWCSPWGPCCCHRHLPLKALSCSGFFKGAVVP